MLSILKDPECCRILREHQGAGYIASNTLCKKIEIDPQLGTETPILTETTIHINESDDEREDRIFRERVARFVNT
jgi:hypothetical protein